MSTLPACVLLLFTSVGLMLSNSEQFMLLGAIICGSVFGSIFQVTRALITKSEEEVPRQLIIYRFASHTSGGVMFGALACVVALYWFKIEMPLVLLGVVSGSIMGWLCERIAKKYEPRILDMLERTGRIPSSKPSDREVLELGRRSTSTADTVKLVPTTKIES